MASWLSAAKNFNARFALEDSEALMKESRCSITVLMKMRMPYRFKILFCIMFMQ